MSRGTGPRLEIAGLCPDLGRVWGSALKSRGVTLCGVIGPDESRTELPSALQVPRVS